MRSSKYLLALLAIFACGVPGQPSAFEPAEKSELQIRWTARTIQVALSTSLTQTSAIAASGSDVVGAVQRALNTWSRTSSISFVVVSSSAQSISPASGRDGINLITIAPTAENLAVFGEGNHTAHTRVFYDRTTGEIEEADIVINPFPYSEDGFPIQFSTDGSPNTYDLESTLAHEIGHLLGLSHSNVISATMQPSQALNGTYGRPALTERSLSDDDVVAVRTVYGPCDKSAAVEGRILNSFAGGMVPAAGALIWLEEIASGRLIASGLTNPAGKFSISCAPAGRYRVMIEYLEGDLINDTFRLVSQVNRLGGRRRAFRSHEISGDLRIAAGKTASLNYILVPPNNSTPELNPRLFGIGELSTVPIPAEPGTTFTVFLAGLGVDQVPGTGFSLSSAFMMVDPSSLALQQPHDKMPVISIEVTISRNAPPGDYSLRLQSNSGEVAYLIGVITVEPQQ
jgi:hypothetical protein